MTTTTDLIRTALDIADTCAEKPTTSLNLHIYDVDDARRVLAAFAATNVIGTPSVAGSSVCVHVGPVALFLPKELFGVEPQPAPELRTVADVLAGAL